MSAVGVRCGLTMVAMRVEDLPVPHVPSAASACGTCGSRVWVAGGGAQVRRLAVAGIRVACVSCAIAAGWDPESIAPHQTRGR